MAFRLNFFLLIAFAIRHVIIGERCMKGAQVKTWGIGKSFHIVPIQKLFYPRDPPFTTWPPRLADSPMFRRLDDDAREKCNSDATKLLGRHNPKLSCPSTRSTGLSTRHSAWKGAHRADWLPRTGDDSGAMSASEYTAVNMFEFVLLRKTDGCRTWDLHQALNGDENHSNPYCEATKCKRF